MPSVWFCRAMKIGLRPSKSKSTENSPSLDNHPTLRIMIGNEAGDHERTETTAVWHLEDNLVGYLQVASLAKLNFDEILVRFSGTTRTWTIKDDPDIYKIMQSFREHRFLTQTQYLQDETGHCRQTGAGRLVYNFPFKFTIPRMLLSCDPNVTEQFLHLPPSLHEGEATNTADGDLWMQPLISYNIRAVVRSRGGADRLPEKMQESREIQLIPFTEASPPLEIGDFPGEFSSISTKTLKMSRFASPFGEMSMSMGEPPPLRFSHNSANAGTIGKIELTLRLLDSIASNINPDTWSCTIESHVLVKTFYSTMPLRSMPTSCLIDTQSRVPSRTDAIRLSVRTINMASWKAGWHYEMGVLANTQKPSWTMTLVVPATVTRTLVPTFCSTLAARRYALRLRLKIKSLHHSTFVLVVPLQVLYSSQVEAARKDTNVQTSPFWQETGDVSDLSDTGPYGTYPQAELDPPDYHRG